MRTRGKLVNTIKPTRKKYCGYRMFSTNNGDHTDLINIYYNDEPILSIDLLNNGEIRFFNIKQGISVEDGLCTETWEKI